MNLTRPRQSAIGIQANDLNVNVDTSYDVSSLSPDQQYNALVTIMEGIDAAYPAPYTQTPPFGEPTPADEITPELVIDQSMDPPAVMEGYSDAELLPVISDAYPQDFPAPYWENDPQYYGLGVPPGVPNLGQPWETGHTQIVVPDFGKQRGWDAWSGKLGGPSNMGMARVARHENAFKSYGKGVNRGGHMVNAQALGQVKYGAPLFTSQQRDLMLAELNRRGIHNVVIQDVPMQTYTEQVDWVDPTSYEQPGYFSEAGVL